MNRVVVIADDLTGANATCSLIRKTGLTTASIMDLEGDLPVGMDALAAATNSRATTPQQAYDAVYKAITKFKADQVDIYNKRTDSTLRGNLGPETNAMLDVLGDERMAIAVPAYPDTNRVVVGGTMMVNGKLLINSDAGHDTKAPVFSSNVTELLSHGFQGSVKTIYLEDVEKGVDHIEQILREEQINGTKMVIFDAFTNDHIKNIADATLRSEVPFVAVDPGPFTLALIRETLDREVRLSRVLMTVGSVPDITVDQLEEVRKTLKPFVVKVDALKLIDPDQRPQEVVRAVEAALEDVENKEVILLTSSPLDGDVRLNLKEVGEKYGMSVEEASSKISKGLAVISMEIVNSGEQFSGLFISGGDITVALCEATDAVGVEIISEIVPLAAYGRIIGGKLDGTRIISKGGMVGDTSTMRYCVEQLRGERA